MLQCECEQMMSACTEQWNGLLFENTLSLLCQSFQIHIHANSWFVPGCTFQSSYSVDWTSTARSDDLDCASRSERSDCLSVHSHILPSRFVPVKLWFVTRSFWHGRYCFSSRHNTHPSVWVVLYPTKRSYDPFNSANSWLVLYLGVVCRKWGKKYFHYWSTLSESENQRTT